MLKVTKNRSNRFSFKPVADPLGKCCAESFCAQIYDLPLLSMIKNLDESSG